MTSAGRVRALNALLDFDAPLASTLKGLRRFPWDCEEPLVFMTESQLANVIERYLSGGLTAVDCEDWANAIESREDVGYGGDRPDLLRDAVFEIANPALTQPFTSERAALLLLGLGRS